MKFTFFNVENPDDVRLGFKPSVTEIGPFSYMEIREKKKPVSIYEEISYGRYVGRAILYSDLNIVYLIFTIFCF